MTYRGVWWVMCWVLLGGAAKVNAQAYQRTTVAGKDLCIAWNRRIYTFHVHSAGSEKTPNNTEFSAIDAAFATWQQLAQSCTDFRFIKGEQVSEVEIGYKQGQTNQNVITFRETNCADVVPSSDSCYADGSCGNKYYCWDHPDSVIALTTVSYSSRTGVIYDADIEFNASPHVGDRTPSFLFTTVSSPPCSDGSESVLCVAADIQNTLTHEIGHAIGLDHVLSIGSTMEPQAPTGETGKRVIDSGTAAGFCETYPKGAPTPLCGDVVQVSRRTFAVNKGTNTGCGAAPSLPLVFLAQVVLGLGARARKGRRPKPNSP